jgi:hypothetical protein
MVKPAVIAKEKTMQGAVLDFLPCLDVSAKIGELT